MAHRLFVLLVLFLCSLAHGIAITRPQHHDEAPIGSFTTFMHPFKNVGMEYWRFDVAPLPQGNTSKQDTEVSIRGAMVSVNVSNINSFTSPGSVAYLSCDTERPNSSSLSPSMLLDKVSHSKPNAIILYTTTGSWCSLEELSVTGKVFTTINANDAQNALSYLDLAVKLSTKARASIKEKTKSISPFDRNATEKRTNRMIIILVCGATGLTFLVFVIAAAVRVGRANPYHERYSPQDGQDEDPSQTRVQKLARAVLDTFPVVKFTQTEAPKTASTDLEMQTLEVHKGATSDTVTCPVEPEVPSCSICTEDFEAQEDVRILPCKHEFHPRCVDPWLVQKSSRCPLW